MQAFKAILIDPYNETVSEVEYRGEFTHIYELLGHGCDVFDLVRINRDGDSIYVDDEGLNKPDRAFFWHKDFAQPLTGCGLVLGCDEEGETVAPKVTLEEIKRAVQFGMPARINGQLVWISSDNTIRPIE